MSEGSLNSHTHHEAQGPQGERGATGDRGPEGNMGMRGMLAQWAQAGAMGCLATVLFIVLSQVRSMHQEGVGTLRSILERQQNVQETLLRDNTQAIRDLSTEIRAMRVERAKGGI